MAGCGTARCAGRRPVGLCLLLATAVGAPATAWYRDLWVDDDGRVLGAETGPRDWSAPEAIERLRLDEVELVQIDSLADWSAIEGRRYDWLISTAAVQRLPDPAIVAYVASARRCANYGLLFIPNLDNRAHLSHRAMAAILGAILKLSPVKRALASEQLRSRYLETLSRLH